MRDPDTSSEHGKWRSLYKRFWERGRAEEARAWAVMEGAPAPPKEAGAVGRGQQRWDGSPNKGKEPATIQKSLDL